MRRELEDVNWRTQLAWLELTLQAASNCTWIVVVGHHPISTRHRTIDAVYNDLLQRSVRPLLARYKVHMYLCGHLHNLQHVNEDGVHYFVSGAGGHLEVQFSFILKQMKNII